MSHNMILVKGDDDTMQPHHAKASIALVTSHGERVAMDKQTLAMHSGVFKGMLSLRD